MTLLPTLLPPDATLDARMSDRMSVYCAYGRSMPMVERTAGLDPPRNGTSRRVSGVRRRSGSRRGADSAADWKSAREVAFVDRVLATAIREGWDQGYTAEVIVATLRPARVDLNVIGPCVYCGSWLADSVDHATPLTRGGAFRGPNCVSACLTCNIRKGTMTRAEYEARLASLPADPKREPLSVADGLVLPATRRPTVAEREADEVFAYLERTMAEHGRVPSLRVMARELRSNVYRVRGAIRHLAKQGRIEWTA